ncbi:WHG domain-containing protein [Gordonia sp. HY285]|uniref:TetR/AcrR family transcriptional regulator n=1 Tax=Gordonia liuliyuniae TaxID=2911517 RepID=UPI001F3026CD|nr:TetR/AcrR family transcriptional regulator [Gordonia liuliyuniae]MCF8610301.1 WHG domain-containing protein [Gordonia liuliyuniae]
MTTDHTPGIRARRRAGIEADLRDVGRRHLAQHGAAALSLRAVARDMGRTPSSLYRYVRDRDDLLTVLIVDAYDDLGDTLDAAVADRSTPRSRFEAFANALRAWAIAHPSEYTLLYGSPVPGYHAPRETTVRAGTRPILTFGAIAADAEVPAVDGTHASRQRAAAAALSATAASDEVAGLTLTADALARTLVVWNLLLGSIASELFEQMGTITDRPDDVWAGVVDLGGGLLFGRQGVSARGRPATSG